MTRTLLGLASLTFLVFWGASSNLSKSGDRKQADDLAAVQAVSKRIIAADNSGDIGAVSDLYEDEAVWLPPSGPVVEGKATILARYKTSFDQLKLEYSEQSVETQMGGNWAFDRGFVRGTATPKDGSAAKETFDKYIMILSRQGSSMENCSLNVESGRDFSARQLNDQGADSPAPPHGSHSC